MGNESKDEAHTPVLLFDDYYNLLRNKTIKNICGYDIFCHTAVNIFPCRVTRRCIRTILVTDNGNMYRSLLEMIRRCGYLDCKKVIDIDENYLINYLTGKERYIGYNNTIIKKNSSDDTNMYMNSNSNNSNTNTSKYRYYDIPFYTEEECNRLIKVCGTTIGLYDRILHSYIKVDVDAYIHEITNEYITLYESFLNKLDSIDRTMMMDIFDNIYNGSNTGIEYYDGLSTIMNKYEQYGEYSKLIFIDHPV